MNPTVTVSCALSENGKTVVFSATAELDTFARGGSTTVGPQYHTARALFDALVDAAVNYEEATEKQ